MAKKKDSFSGYLLILGLVAIGIMVDLVKKYWPFLLAAGLIYLLYWLITKSRKSDVKSNPTETITIQVRAQTQTYQPPLSTSKSFTVSSEETGAIITDTSLGKAVDISSSPVSKEEAPETSLIVSLGHTDGHRIPTPPKEYVDKTRWLAAGESVQVAGTTISGGLLYVGPTLEGSYGVPDPALIDPRKSVAKSGDFTERQMNYWPSYSDITPQARRAYLNWLADGRKHPDADVGFVFLYFYGLERRSIIDISKNGGDVKELASILDELRRLLGIYGKSNSFRSYCSRLIDFLSLVEYPAKIYETKIPQFPDAYELPYYLRLAIGQTAVHGVAVPAHLALAWAEADSNIVRRTAITRCREEFRNLFALKYREFCGDGIKLTPNKTKLKLVYNPASSGFRGQGEVTLRFGDVPDVTVLMAPVRKLQAVVDACVDALGPYSRYVGKNPGKEAALEALVQLPAQIWPSEARRTLEQLKGQIGADPTLMKVQQLASSFNSTGEFTRDKLLAFAKALESEQIGIEPDLLGGAKTPKLDDYLVLFQNAEPTLEPRSTSAYQAAVITLELAAAVAHADGDFSASEATHLNANIDAWVHLTESHRARLKAKVRLLMASPITLAGMKKKVEPLDMAAREAIASFAALLVQSDGMARPEEVKLLEKVYTLLGLDKSKAYSQLHAAASGAPATTPLAASTAVTTSTQTTPSTFKLDADRIAALQKDSEKVSALLGNIFKEEVEANQPVPEQEDEMAAVGEHLLLGLDSAHSAFARTILSRHSWERAEVADVASDLQIMLDGALERVNEAAFDAYDMPMTEGDDPIEINPEFLEKFNNEYSTRTA